MKIPVLVFLSAALGGCASSHEIQMDMVDVQLVRIDTVQRYPNAEQQVLTWRTANNIDVVTFQPLNTSYIVGSRMRVLMRK